MIVRSVHDEKYNILLCVLFSPLIGSTVDYIDRSFGFVSAVEAAQNSIRTAKTGASKTRRQTAVSFLSLSLSQSHYHDSFSEAQCNMPNGIGIIKLMGRSAGFLAAYAALGSGDVDAVLIPEVPIELDGPDGILPFIHQRLIEQKYAVIVVAEVRCLSLPTERKILYLCLTK